MGGEHEETDQADQLDIDGRYQRYIADPVSFLAPITESPHKDAGQKADDRVYD